MWKVAQLVERRFVVPVRAGSIPVFPPNKKTNMEESNIGMDGVARVDCVHANSESEYCLEWRKNGNEYCNGCTFMMPAEKQMNNTGIAGLYLDIKLANTPTIPDETILFNFDKDELDSGKARKAVVDDIASNIEKWCTFEIIHVNVMEMSDYQIKIELRAWHANKEHAVDEVLVKLMKND